MRFRALLCVLGLAAAALSTGVGGASAATLFTSTAHTQVVTVGAIADATSVGPIDFTTTQGALFYRCTHSSFGLRVDQNGGGRVGLTVTSSTFALGCVGALGNYTGTHTPPWLITIEGTGTTIGTQTSFAAIARDLRIDFQSAGLFTGDLLKFVVTTDTNTINTTTTPTHTDTTPNGLTAVQPTVAGSPLCIVAEAAGRIASPASGFALNIDARYCLTGSAGGWSLTN